MKNIKLIPATEKDKAFFRHAHHAAYRKVIESMFGWDEGLQNKAADRDFVSRQPHLIEWGHAVVGVIGWQDRGDYLWFGPLYILPEYQGKGIGSFLINQFMSKAKARGLPLRLQTLKENVGAKRLYERLGFYVTSSDNVHWKMEYM